MGLHFMLKRSELCEPTVPPNPNPHRFIIVSTYQTYRNPKKPILVEVHYPDCTNYEGKKLIVFRTQDVFLQMSKKNHIDPHFHNKDIIARFNPEMFDTAVKFVNMISHASIV